jgi:hypothetical protein
MPLIDQDTLKSFLGSKSFITLATEGIDGHEDAIAQADNIVYQKVPVPIPADAADAIPSLQFCSHAIYIYIVSQRQKLSDKEVSRIDKLYSNAMRMLDEFQSGKTQLLDADGEIVTTDKPEITTYDVDNTDRSERW